MNILEHQNIISKNRTELMGFAILWIFLFHSKIYFPDSALFLPFKFIKDIGFGAVDIFIFLSGFGLMHGTQKKSYTPFAFYRRRFFRIFPAYLIAVAISLLVKFYLGGEITLTEILLKMSSLWFWFEKGRFLWYIPAILMLYILFPVFYRLYIYSSNKILTVLLMVFIAYSLSGIAVACGLNYYLIFLTRIPIFVLGAHFGYSTENQILKSYRFSLMAHLFLLLIAIVLLVVIQVKIPFRIRQDTGLQWYPFLLVVYPLLIIISNIFNHIKNKETKTIALAGKRLLYFIGTYSLEIYLLHEHVVFPIGENIWRRNFITYPLVGMLNKGNILEYFVFFVVTVILALILNKISCRVSIS